MHIQNLKAPILISAALVSSLVAFAQSYSIPWFKIAGGGVSTGGIYAVSGSIGQVDAAQPLANGQYSIMGGFWPAFQLVQTPGAPFLDSDLQPGHVLRVFWPRSNTGYVLDQTTLLARPSSATVWSQVPFPYQTNATQISVTVSPAGRHFYRLRRP